MWFAIFFLSIIATFKLLDEFYRLTLSDNLLSAIDLRILKNGVDLWFKNATFTKLSSGLYPPATYVTVWPLIGWTGFETARYVLLFIYIPCIFLICKIFSKYALTRGSEETILCIIVPLSLNALAVCIGNGQLTLVSFALMIYSILLLQSKKISFAKEFVISVFIVIAMIRPTVTVPFFFIMLFVFDNKRVFYLSISIYVIITLLSYYLRDNSIPNVMYVAENTYKSVNEVILYGSETGGYANIHSLLIYFGLEKFNVPLSLILAVVLGIWIYRNNKADLWILFGVTAIFSRVWVYHKVYDDVLILVPIITLFRLIRKHSNHNFIRTGSLTLLILTILSMMMPATMFQHIDYYNYLFIWVHAINWLILLAFLIFVNRIDKTEYSNKYNIQKSSD